MLEQNGIDYKKRLMDTLELMYQITEILSSKSIRTDKKCLKDTLNTLDKSITELREDFLAGTVPQFDKAATMYLYMLLCNFKHIVITLGDIPEGERIVKLDDLWKDTSDFFDKLEAMEGIKKEGATDADNK